MKLLAALAVIAALNGCAAKPVLYPNARFKEAGETQREADLADCRKLAKDYVKSRKAAQVAGGAAGGAAVGAAAGAATGAVFGGVGRGAMGGGLGGAIAGLFSGLFRARQPSPAHMGFVNHCLSERGYDVVGWE